MSDALPGTPSAAAELGGERIRPPEGAWCRACHGMRWWTELHAPKGWRCMNCHPPAHLAPDQVEIVGGVSR